MVDRPIIFSAPMVRALLAGSKTQTRRIIKGRERCSLFNGQWTDIYVLDPGNESWRMDGYPWRVKDRLWVRETHDIIETNKRAIYRADILADYPGAWRPSIHMPRWASRITLSVTDVRVHRLQDISEDDAEKEGARRCFEDDWFRFFEDDPRGSFLTGFKVLWKHLHGADAWDANPWVAAISFNVERRNIDAVERKA